MKCWRCGNELTTGDAPNSAQCRQCEQASISSSPASACSAPTVAELIDHIQGMRSYYTGPLHQPSPRCVCRGCIDEKLAAWRKAQNAHADGSAVADTVRRDVGSSGSEGKA